MVMLFALAGVGLVLSLVVHLSTFAGVNPEAAFPGVWGLHVGFLALWVPAILVARRRSIAAGPGSERSGIMEHAPRWLRAVCSVFFAYAFFNFFFTIFVLNRGGGPRVIDGRKVLHNHGKIIRELTDEEYERHQAYVARTFSGHWMLFYGVAAAMLYPRGRRAIGPPDRTGRGNAGRERGAPGE